MKQGTPKKVQIIPLPEELSCLISTEASKNIKPSSFLKQTKEDFSKLSSLQEKYLSKSSVAINSNEKKGFLNKSIEELRLIPHCIAFAHKKLEKSVLKYRSVKRNIEAAICTDMSILVLFFQNSIDIETPVVIDFVGLFHHVENKYESSYSFQKYSSRISKLKEFLKRNESAVRYPTVSKICLMSTLQGVEYKFDDRLKYIPYNVFDETLLSHFYSTGFEGLDDTIGPLTGSPKVEPETLSPTFSSPSIKLNSRKQNRKVSHERCKSVSITRMPVLSPSSFSLCKPDYRPFNIFLHKFFDEFEIADYTQRNIVRVSLLRIVYDRAYFFDHTLNDYSTPSLLAAGILQQLTLSDLTVPTGIFPDSYRNHTVLDSCLSVKGIREILPDIELLPFFVCPIDIARLLFIVSSRIEGLYKPNDDTPMKMCFDDFFIVFASIFSLRFPPNSLGIASLLDHHRSLEIPHQLSHAATSFCALNSFFCGFLDDNHSPELKQKINLLLNKNKL